MTKLPLVTYVTLQKIALAKGFRLARVSGSHHIFRNSTGHILTIPNHGSRPIGRALLRKLLHQMGISPDEYQNILEQV
jgi:predicted RNA binding protein YcfA (HicA-like mRNA interferase family)